MSYGFMCVNESSYVQLDADSPRLCVLAAGTYSGTRSASATFARAITSQDPPIVFIRPTPGGVQVSISVWFSGGPGNWTGFLMLASNVTSSLSGKYFIAAWSSMGTSDFGMRIWNDGSSLVYDSGAPAVMVTFAAGNWSFLAREQLSVGARYSWRIGKFLSENEYISINSFAMCCHNGASGGSCGIAVDYGNSRILMYSLSSNGWTDQGHRPFLCAKYIDK